MTSASIIVPSASIPAARQNRSKLARTSTNASSTAPVAGEPAGVMSLVLRELRLLRYDTFPSGHGRPDRFSDYCVHRTAIAVIASVPLLTIGANLASLRR